MVPEYTTTFDVWGGLSLCCMVAHKAILNFTALGSNNSGKLVTSIYITGV